VHVLSEGQVWLNLLPMLIRRFPLVVTVHDVRPHPGDRDTARVPRAVVELFIRQADALIVHGEGLREEAVLRLKTPRDRIHLGLHPPLSRYREIATAQGMVKPDDGVFRMLFFGRIFAYKGLDHLIDAEPLIGEDVTPRRVIIAGRGDDMAGHVARMRDPARFDVRARAIGDEEAASLFASADLLVLPYIEASQSGVLMIAAAFGLPVVASDVGELGALVRRTGMGLTTPPGDARALAGRITALARDPAARAELSAAAEKALKGPLSDEAVWAHAEAAYRSALRRRRGL
jgi:glycosyltransferase involved in cell wall biosynthesis